MQPCFGIISCVNSRLRDAAADTCKSYFVRDTCSRVCLAIVAKGKKSGPKTTPWGSPATLSCSSHSQDSERFLFNPLPG
ncbi:hypothetical protein J6590_039708 [Homalodisca vitripennis]|nr:hypothetical protein J6590_039708 [Homalodisca vitripennis]